MADRDLDEEPASVMISAGKGLYDINNISGRAKTRLIMQGEIAEEAFVTPANMPGKKLKQLRERHSKNIESGIKSISTAENVFKIGDLIKYRGTVAQVLEVHPIKGVKVRKREGGKVWVHHTNAKLAEDSKED